MTSKYLFILGRNPELSRQEILSYLKSREIQKKIISEQENLLLIEAEINPSEMISSLGGTIAIGRVLVSGGDEEILSYIEKNPIYYGEENKFQYSILNFAENPEIEEAIKENFRKEKLKSIRKNPELTPEKLSGLVNYFFFSGNFGVIQSVYDTCEAEKKDMEKPIRRSELAISPRLARILINLSQVKENETLLDPFCGIGVIMQEALLSGINVIGIDINRKACENAKRNLLWIQNKYKTRAKWKIINKDSARVILKNIDGIACEPNLGILLKSSPNQEKAREMIKKFENTIIFILTNLRHYLKQGGKIAFTSPLILTGNGRVSCNINKILDKLELNLVSRFREERKGQVIGREIFVLEKH